MLENVELFSHAEKFGKLHIVHLCIGSVRKWSNLVSPWSDGLIDTPFAYTWTEFDKMVDIGGHVPAAHEALEGGVFPALQLGPDVPQRLEVAGSDLHLSRRIHRYP